MSNDYTFDATDAIGWMPKVLPLSKSNIGYVIFRGSEIQFGKYDEDWCKKPSDYLTPLSPRITLDLKDANTCYASMRPLLKKLRLDRFFRADAELVNFHFRTIYAIIGVCEDIEFSFKMFDKKMAEMEAKDK